MAEIAFKDIEVSLLALLNKVNIFIIIILPITLEVRGSKKGILDRIISMITRRLSQCILDLFK